MYDLQAIARAADLLDVTSPRPAEVLLVLWKYRDHVVSRSRLADEIFSISGDHLTDDAIHCAVSKLRSAIRQTGHDISIESRSRIGFALTAADEASLIRAGLPSGRGAICDDPSAPDVISDRLPSLSPPSVAILRTISHFRAGRTVSYPEVAQLHFRLHGDELSKRQFKRHRHHINRAFRLADAPVEIRPIFGGLDDFRWEMRGSLIGWLKGEPTTSPCGEQSVPTLPPQPIGAREALVSGLPQDLVDRAILLSDASADSSFGQIAQTDKCAGAQPRQTRQPATTTPRSRAVGPKSTRGQDARAARVEAAQRKAARKQEAKEMRAKAALLRAAQRQEAKAARAEAAMLRREAAEARALEQQERAFVHEAALLAVLYRNRNRLVSSGEIYSAYRKLLPRWTTGLKLTSAVFNLRLAIRSNGWPIQIENAHYLGYQMRVDATWALDDGSHPILLKALHHLRTANVPEFGQNSILAVAEVLGLPETPSLIFATLWNRRGAFVSRTRLHEDFSLWFGGELHADNRTYLLNIVRRRLERLELPVFVEAVQGTGWRLGLASQEWEPEAFKAADWSFHDVTDIEGDISTLLQNGSVARVVLALSKMRGQPRSLQAIQERHEGCNGERGAETSLLQGLRMTRAMLRRMNAPVRVERTADDLWVMTGDLQRWCRRDLPSHITTRMLSQERNAA